jgi:hypothetical protein
MFRKAHYDKGYEQGRQFREENPHLRGRALDKFVAREDMEEQEESGFYAGYRDEEYAPYGYDVDVDNDEITRAEAPRGFFSRLFGL